jgi:hypothetical protein
MSVQHFISETALIYFTSFSNTVFFLAVASQATQLTPLTLAGPRPVITGFSNPHYGPVLGGRYKSAAQDPAV